MSKKLNIHENLEYQVKISPEENLKLTESASKGEFPSKITTVVEAIHSGMTRNYTYYPADNLEKSVESWTRPYDKPVIKNHDIYEEAVGRVKSATFKKSNLSSDKHTIELELEITDSQAIQKVMDGRYQTLSIGGTTSSAICNICGKDLVKEGFCGHMKGRTYEGTQAHWIIGEMDFDEISWVNVPADGNAQVVHKNTATAQKESSSNGGGVTDMKVKDNADKHTEDLLDQIDKLKDAANEDPDPAQVADQDNPDTQPDAPVVIKPTEQEDNPDPAPTLEEQLQALQEKLDAAVAESESKDVIIAALTDEKEQLEEKVTTLEARIEEMTTTATQAEESYKAAVKQNITLATYAHRTLAESVTSLQIALGKEAEEKRDELIAKFSKESGRMLKEQVSVLVKERPQRIVQTIDSPALPDTSTDPGTTSEKKEDKELTIDDLAEAMSRVFNKTN